MTAVSIAKKLPGPSISQFFSLLRAFRDDRLQFLTDCARTYGDRVALRLGWKPAILLSHPDDIETVLTNSRDVRKPWYLRGTTFLGRGLLVSDGDYWRRQRRFLQPAFHRKRIAAYGDAMVAYSQSLGESWREGETRDIHEDMMRLTMNIVTKTLFDLEPGGEAEKIGSGVEAVQSAFDARMNSLVPVPESWPTPGNLRLREAARRIDDTVYGFIRRRREDARDRGDVLSMLLQAQAEEDGTRMTDTQVRDEALNLFLAGHETTASAMSWMWYLLARNPDVEDRLVAELDRVLGDRIPTIDDIPRLEFTGMVVDEVLRLYPPGFMLGREAVHDCELNGLAVSQGTTLLMSQWVVHRDPRFFDDPEVFRPERWTEEFRKSLPKYAYFPFGGGQHQCIGDVFSLMEMKLGLATIAREFKLELVPGQSMVPRALFTLRPKTGARFTVRRRESARLMIGGGSR